jgi:predicted nucleotide-binding protein
LDSTIHRKAKDVTRDFLDESQKRGTERKDIVNSKQVFIVHGHDSGSKYELARIIENDFKLKSIILHELPDMGKTVIEKLENISEMPGYVFVLLTPDDIGVEKIEGMTISDLNNADPNRKGLKIDFKYRARQNVVLELGYFIGKLGRNRVCCLYRGEVDIPSDVSGVLYKKFTNSVSEVYGEIRKELNAAGYMV